MATKRDKKLKEINDEVFSLDKIDLTTDAEKKYHDTYLNKLQGYADGKVDGIQIKQLTAGAAVIAKKQQSRSSTAALKWSVNRALGGHTDLTPEEE